MAMYNEFCYMHLYYELQFHIPTMFFMQSILELYVKISSQKLDAVSFIISQLDKTSLGICLIHYIIIRCIFRYDDIL